MTSETADVVVVGCGGFGAACMYHLARRGMRVVGIDRHHPPHDQGSSHGQTRVTRKAYFEHPDYVPLLHQAAALWQQLEQETGRQLFTRSGLLLAGPADGEIITGTRLAMQQHKLEIESWTPQQTMHRFPQFRIPADSVVLFEADAGYLWSERCIDAHLDAAQRHGGRLLPGETVSQLLPAASGVTITTPLRTITASHAVVTAGAWTAELLPDYGRWIQIRRKTLFWYPVKSREWASPDCPIHLFDMPTGQFYGFPSLDGQTIKLAEHSGGQPVGRVEDLDRTATPDEAEPITSYAAGNLHGVDDQPVASSVCMYSMSPDGHFLLDHHPDQSLTVAAGFSGHGFKFTSVLGAAIADLICDGSTQSAIEFLSSSRLT